MVPGYTFLMAFSCWKCLWECPGNHYLFRCHCYSTSINLKTKSYHYSHYSSEVQFTVKRVWYTIVDDSTTVKYSCPLCKKIIDDYISNLTVESRNFADFIKKIGLMKQGRVKVLTSNGFHLHVPSDAPIITHLWILRKCWWKLYKIS